MIEDMGCLEQTQPVEITLYWVFCGGGGPIKHCNHWNDMRIESESFSRQMTQPVEMMKMMIMRRMHKKTPRGGHSCSVDWCHQYISIRSYFF